MKNFNKRQNPETGNPLTIKEAEDFSRDRSKFRKYVVYGTRTDGEHTSHGAWTPIPNRRSRYLTPAACYIKQKLPPEKKKEDEGRAHTLEQKSMPDDGLRSHQQASPDLPL